MRKWRILPPQDANIHFRFPLDFVQDTSNKLYYLGSEDLDEFINQDGPWSIIRISEYQRTDKLITLQLFNIEFEALEFDYFDVLADEAGFLYLRKDELESLIDLLIFIYGDKNILPADETEKFKKLPGIQSFKWRLSDSPTLSKNTSIYWQKSNVAKDSQLSELKTFLLFEHDKDEYPKRVFWGIYQFHKTLLEDTSFQPLDRGMAIINIYKQELRDLIAILLNQASLLVN